VRDQSLYKSLESLPDDLKRQVLDFVEFLKKKHLTGKRAKKPERKSQFGHAKGQISMSEDFDAPLEEFKDYM